MKWTVQAIGKPALDYAKRGIAEYEKRLKRLAQLEIDYLGKDQGQQKNTETHLQRSEGAMRIVMDERGKSWTTEQWVDQVNRWEMQGVKRVSLMIGGADGHPQKMRDQADVVLSLSALTMQHELALVVLLEQIYRVYTIKRGEPYHR